MSPVMGWQESADRSLFMSKMAAGCAHVLSWMEPVASEPMYRLHCSTCSGDAWVNLWPARQQGADPDAIIEHVEGAIRERSKASP